MMRLIPNVVQNRSIDAKQLGWVAGRRAETRSNFPANFQYVDLRGFSVEDVDRAVDEELEAYAYLEVNGFSQQAIDAVDRGWASSLIAPMLDFGVAAAVVALSALGCVPVTSCRGPTLGLRPHSQPAPMIVFYARRAHVAPLIEAVSEADCQAVNNHAKAEIYSDDVRKMHRFALALRRQLRP